MNPYTELSQALIFCDFLDSLHTPQPNNKGQDNENSNANHTKKRNDTTTREEGNKKEKTNNI